jgi:hypothetical protein
MPPDPVVWISWFELLRGTNASANAAFSTISKILANPAGFLAPVVPKGAAREQGKVEIK